MPSRPDNNFQDVRPDPGNQVLNITAVQRGDLLRVRHGIVVLMGRVAEGTRAETYTWAGVDDEEWQLEAGEIATFMGVLQDDDDAVVVLARGQIGWVFIDEVEVA